MILRVAAAEVASFRKDDEVQEGCWYVRLEGNKRGVSRIKHDLAGPRIVRERADDIEDIH